MDEVKAKRNSTIIKYALLSIGAMLILAGLFYIFYTQNEVREIVRQENENEKVDVIDIDKEKKEQERNSTDDSVQKPESKQADVLLERCLQEPLDDYRKDANDINGLNYFYASMLATVENDIAVCDMLKKDEDIRQCQDRFYTFTSVASKNDQCAKIGDVDLAGFCNARIKNDPSFCRGTVSMYNTVFCEAAITGDVGKCNSLTDEYRGQCLDNITLVKAFESNRMEDCDNIHVDTRDGRFNRAQCRILLGDDPQKEWVDVYKNNACLEKYIFKVVMEKKDISICERIPQKLLDNKQLYDECKKQF